MVPERPHGTYSGTSRGNVLGFVALPSQADMWYASRKEKKLIFDNHFFGSDTAVSAINADDSGDSDGQMKDEDMQPTFYHSMPRTLYETMLNSWSVTGVIDCYPGAGELILACIGRRIPVVAFALTEAHYLGLKQAGG